MLEEESRFISANLSLFFLFTTMIFIYFFFWNEETFQRASRDKLIRVGVAEIDRVLKYVKVI